MYKGDRVDTTIVIGIIITKVDDPVQHVKCFLQSLPKCRVTGITVGIVRLGIRNSNPVGNNRVYK